MLENLEPTLVGTYQQKGPDIREKRRKDIAKYSVVVGFILLLADIVVEQITYPVGNIEGMYFAYFAVPFFIFSALVSAYLYSYKNLKTAWENRRIKLLSLSAGIAYALFYLFTTNMVAPPDVPVSPNQQSYILPFQVYGHMTMWPDVEFFSHQLNLEGYFSVGNVLVVSSLAILTTISVALLAHNIEKKLYGRSSGSFAGSIAVSLSTNACCCCTPVVVPAVSAFVGLASTNPSVESVTFQTWPVFNLLWIGTIGLLLFSVLLSIRKLDCGTTTVASR